MQVDAHYYAIFAFCRAVGFKKRSAHVIAYASQFVDDAKINHIIPEDINEDIDYEIINDMPSFFNIATAHSYFHPNTYNYNAMINNTIAFHFVPGCKGANFSKKLRCAEESPIIMEILEEAKQSDNLIKLGIVLHSYADTFSHQGFSGLISKVNDINKCIHISNIFESWNLDTAIAKIRKRKFFNNRTIKKYLDRLLPPYGHAQSLKYPDIPYLKWEYRYDYTSEFSNEYITTKIDNKDRFSRAFKKIIEHLNEYLKIHPKYLDEEMKFNNYEILFNTLIKEGCLEARIKNWENIIVEERLVNKADTDIINYDKNLWLKDSFLDYEKKKYESRKVYDTKLRPNFKNTNWYKYYLAVKWYKKRFYKYSGENSLNIQM